MIVSPSDVKEERKIVKKVLYEWNERNSRFRNIVFSVLGYDINAHADSGTYPQESINDQLLEKADFIIAIFWTKLGTPTEKYQSGSVEEIEKHIEQNKQAFIFFKDPEPENKESEQFKKVQQYKESLKERVLYREGFKSKKDFEYLLGKEIDLIANDLSRPQPITVKERDVSVKVEKCKDGTVKITFNDSSTIEFLDKKVLFSDIVLPPYQDDSKILSRNFITEAEVHPLKDESCFLEYTLDASKIINNELKFIMEIVICQKVREEDNTIQLRIPYITKSMTINIDIKEAPFIKSNGVAKLKYNNRELPYIKQTFNESKMIYTLQIDQTIPGGYLNFNWHE